MTDAARAPMPPPNASRLALVPNLACGDCKPNHRKMCGDTDRAIDGADQQLAAVLQKAKLWQPINRGPVNDRQRLVINRMLDGFEGFLTTSKYGKLAKCSSDTALRDIQQLVERGILVRNPGRGRSTSYRLADAEDVPD